MTAWPRLLTFRSRLTLRWTLAFGILLALANAAIYGTVRRYLFHDLDVKVRTVAATELASSTDRMEIHLHEPAVEDPRRGAGPVRVVRARAPSFEAVGEGHA